MPEANTVAEQIKILLDNLREDVATTKAAHEAATLALRNALASFKPATKGRPAKIPGAPRVKREAKVYTTARNDADGIEAVGDGNYTVIGKARIYSTRAAAIAATKEE